MSKNQKVLEVIITQALKVSNDLVRVGVNVSQVPWKQPEDSYDLDIDMIVELSVQSMKNLLLYYNIGLMQKYPPIFFLFNVS